MVKKNIRGFTLIELIAVLVIMAIIALIVTPLVMNIIRKARISADKRSVDAYGRSIELAIATYLLDTGKFPTSMDQLTIEYSGSEVVCSKTQLNDDSSVYLSGCRVAGRNVDYIYGIDKMPRTYSVGDEVIYNNINYYVIKDSGINDETVTLLKAEPLTVDEVNLYGGAGTANNHVNRYTTYSVGTANNVNGYGSVAYYSSDTCGFINTSYVKTGCDVNYEVSDVKYIVDAWKASKAPIASEARLITTGELSENLGYGTTSFDTYPKTDNVPTWVYNSNYWYFTMSQYRNLQYIWHVKSNGDTFYDYPYEIMTVRPVIVLKKVYLIS